MALKWFVLLCSSVCPYMYGSHITEEERLSCLNLIVLCVFVLYDVSSLQFSRLVSIVSLH